jgi:hypothetical protein
MFISSFRYLREPEGSNRSKQQLSSRLKEILESTARMVWLIIQAWEYWEMQPIYMAYDKRHKGHYFRTALLEITLDSTGLFTPTNIQKEFFQNMHRGQLDFTSSPRN